MGRIENSARKRRRKRNIEGAVLAAVGTAGIIATVMIAPNIFQILPRIAGDKYKLPYRAKTAAGKLAQKGLVRFVNRKGKKYVEITEKGRRVLLFEEAKRIHRKKRRWDKRYRLVMFDVPDRRKTVRDRLRFYMKKYDFLKVQDSVWLYPHDCEDIVALIKADLRIGKDVLYAVVESIENDGWIRRHFGLK